MHCECLEQRHWWRDDLHFPRWPWQNLLRQWYSYQLCHNFVRIQRKHSQLRWWRCWRRWSRDGRNGRDGRRTRGVGGSKSTQQFRRRTSLTFCLGSRGRRWCWCEEEGLRRTFQWSKWPRWEQTGVNWNVGKALMFRITSYWKVSVHIS